MDPVDPDNWIILSAIDEKLGFQPAGLEHLRYARLISPDDPDVWLQSAKIRWQLQDFDGVFADITQALSINFTDRENRLLYADWLGECGHFDLAQVHYRFLQSYGYRLELPELAKALSCAFCSGNIEDTHHWVDHLHANNFETDEITSLIAEEILYLCPPGQAGQLERLAKELSAEAGQLVGEVAEQLSVRQSSVDWQHYFDRRAHAGDYGADIKSSPLNALARRVLDAIRQDGRYLPQVLDLGCGSGGFATALATLQAEDSSSDTDNGDINPLLIGVDYSIESIRVANKRNGYDNLVHCDLDQEVPADLVSASDHIIISDVLEYCADPEKIVGDVTDRMLAGSTLYVTWNPSVNQQGEWGDIFRAAKWSDGWVMASIDIAEREAVTLSKEPLEHAATDTPGRDSRAHIEAIANRLIRSTQLLNNGKYDSCYEISNDVLNVFPDSSQALLQLGVHAQDQKDFDRALYYFRRALARDKGFASAWFHIGAVYQQLKRNPGLSAACYEKCLKYAPGNRTANINLAQIHLPGDNVDATWSVLRRILTQHPLDVQQLETVESMVKSRSDDALAKKYNEYMDSADWLKVQLSQALQRKYIPRSEELIRQLGDLNTSEAELLFYRAQLAEKSGELKLAIQYGRKLVRHDRKNHIYWQFLASASAAQGKLVTSFRLWGVTASVTGPKDPALQNRLFFANYYPLRSAQTISDLHFEWGEALSVVLESELDKRTDQGRAHEKLRIGYVSGDFRMHSVAIFFYNILKYRDSDRFEVYCYSTTPGEDYMTTKLRLFSDYWRNIGSIDDAAAAALIRRDEIDILVDLAGHTAMNRLPLFCRRPAPVQCTYIGYPNTTGLKEIDYRITDYNADPPGMNDGLHSEELIRLPHGFLSYSRHMTSTPVTIEQTRHPTRHYTFVCCNNIYKVNDLVIEIWVEILKQLPEARLLLKAHNLNNAEIIETYQQKFNRRGIGADQLHLMNTIDVGEHQNLYNHVDIALDPFPYNGTTTTCDALWMGVPVLVLAGDRHAGRVGVSILTQVGLTDWIAEDEEDYINKAVQFAEDDALLRYLKLTMRRKLWNSPLMKPGMVTHDLEAAFQQMWQRHTEGT